MIPLKSSLFNESRYRRTISRCSCSISISSDSSADSPTGQIKVKIVVAAGILFNISRVLKDEGPEDDSDSEDYSVDEERGNS